MSKQQDLRRISLRTDQVLEVHFDKLPDPPPEMMKLPGMAVWWTQMKLARERDMQAFQRMVNNFNSSP